MKKIEDYIHLYIGCDVMITLNADIAPKKAKLIGVYIDELEQCNQAVQVDFGKPAQRLCYLLSQVKLILRPLSSMTEEEVKELESTKALQRPSPVHPIAMLVWTAETYRLAMSKHFDIFGLIDANLALDATKIEKV